MIYQVVWILAAFIMQDAAGSAVVVPSGPELAPCESVPGPGGVGMRNYVVATLTMNVGKWNDDKAPVERRHQEMEQVIQQMFIDLGCLPAIFAVSIQEGMYADVVDKIVEKRGYAPAMVGHPSEKTRNPGTRCISGGVSSYALGRYVCLLVYVHGVVEEDMVYDYKIINNISEGWGMTMIGGREAYAAKGFLMGIFHIGDRMWIFEGAHFKPHVNNKNYDRRRAEFQAMMERTEERRNHYAEKYKMDKNNIVGIAFGDWNTRYHKFFDTVYGIKPPDEEGGDEEKWRKPLVEMKFKGAKKKSSKPWGAKIVPVRDTFEVQEVSAGGQFAEAGVQVGWKIEEIDGTEVNHYNKMEFQMMLVPGAELSMTITFNTETRKIDPKAWRVLNPTHFKYDGLYRTIIDENMMVKGWKEAGGISFPPTYRIEYMGTSMDELTYNNVQIPSWTDRIIVYDPTNSKVKTLRYDSIPFQSKTDHIPVWAAFSWENWAPSDWNSKMVLPLPPYEVFLKNVPSSRDIDWDAIANEEDMDQDIRAGPKLRSRLRRRDAQSEDDPEQDRPTMLTRKSGRAELLEQDSPPASPPKMLTRKNAAYDLSESDTNDPLGRVSSSQTTFNNDFLFMKFFVFGILFVILYYHFFQKEGHNIELQYELLP